MYRPAVHEDAWVLADLERSASSSALAHVFPPGLPYPLLEVQARWSLVLEDPDVTTLTAWDGERLIGFAAYDHACLRHLAVAPDHFGSGLADDLHGQVVAAWRVGRLPRAQLWVLEDNHRARRFYERRGWVLDDRRQECPWPPYPTEVGYELVTGPADP